MPEKPYQDALKRWETDSWDENPSRFLDQRKKLEKECATAKRAFDTACRHLTEAFDGHAGIARQ